MSFVDLNAPDQGALLGNPPAIRDGSKGARNIKRMQSAGGGLKRRRRKGDAGGEGDSGAEVTPTQPIDQPPKTRYEVRRAYLDLDRQTWRVHWLDTKNLFDPYGSRNLDDGGVPNRGNKKMQYIVDNCPLLALRSLASGLFSGMTSPSRPWFRLRPDDDDLYQLPGVAAWCERVTDAVHKALARSNFYRAMPRFYKEIGCYGTAALGQYEIPYDPRHPHQPVINFEPYTIGEYWCAQNPDGIVDTFVRIYKWTVRQIIMRFVQDPQDPDDPCWANVAPSTVAMWRARKWDTYVEVVHFIEPNTDYQPGILGVRGMPFRSVYYELGGSPTVLLGVYGFRTNPVKVARWETNSDNTYGYGPAMYCLGDAKQLMVQQKRKQQAIDKQVEPPLIGDAALKRTTVSMLPGDVTWLEQTSANSYGLKPLYEVKPDIVAMVADIEQTQKRINDGMYASVFQLMRFLDENLKAGITATEINARKQEQLLEMGPLLDRLNGEALGPVIEDTFTVLARRSRIAWQYVARGLAVPPGVEQYLPPPPRALQGKKVGIEYISILAQAVRIAEVQGIQQVVAFAMSVVQAVPNAMDNINLDKAIAIIGDRNNVPPEVLRTVDQLKAMRDQRAQQQQQQQRAQMLAENAGGMAGAAKDLSQTPVGGSNALDQLLNGPAAPQQQAA